MEKNNINTEEDEELSFQIEYLIEVKEIINNIQSNKSPESNSITAAHLKFVGTTLIKEVNSTTNIQYRKQSRLQ